MNFFGDLIELILQAVVVVYIHGALHEDIDRMIEILLGRVQVASLVVH